jgi:UrcA family protein
MLRSIVISANPNRRICKVAATLFASLPIVAASVAWAADIILPNGGRAAPVSIADLNISTLEGQLLAQDRVRSKARTLCNRMFDPLDLGPHEHYVQCVATATDQAMRQILAAGFARAAQVSSSPDAPGNDSIQEEGQAQRAQVSLTDLDLSTTEGVRAAHERLHDVARRLCAKLAEESEISHQPNFVKCVGHAMATARIDVKKLPLESNSGL